MVAEFLPMSLPYVIEGSSQVFQKSLCFWDDEDDMVIWWEIESLLARLKDVVCLAAIFHLLSSSPTAPPIKVLFRQI